MTNYRVHGITDDTDTCEICGRIDLRSVVMLAVLDAEGAATGEIVYAGSTCAARKLAVRVTSARVRDAAAAAERVRSEAAVWADEFSSITLNQFIAANSTAAMNASNGDVSVALTLAKRWYAEVIAEASLIKSGIVTGTRFEKRLPVL